MSALSTILRKFLLIIALITAFTSLSLAQGVDEVCTGQIKRYKVSGYPDSEFIWKVEGGTIVEQTALGDTITVEWGNTIGTFWLKVVEHNFGCFSDTVYAQINIHQIPSINLDPLVLICTGQTVSLDAGTGFDSYLWSTGEATQAITVSEAGTYWVEAESFCGMAYDTVIVDVRPQPIADAGEDVFIKKGEHTTLVAAYFDSYSYLWEPSQWLTNPNSHITDAMPEETTVFTLTVTDEYGCTNSDFVTVFVDDEVLTIYNAFTPNDDGFNDTWVIENIHLFPDAEIAVFDRNSRRVFHTIGYANDWNGTHYRTGRKLPFGTYYYIIHIPSADKTFRGAVSIIR